MAAPFAAIQRLRLVYNFMHMQGCLSFPSHNLWHRSWSATFKPENNAQVSRAVCGITLGNVACLLQVLAQGMKFVVWWVVRATVVQHQQHVLNHLWRKLHHT
jgi:hypothetical protein